MDGHAKVDGHANVDGLEPTTVPDDGGRSFDIKWTAFGITHDFRTVHFQSFERSTLDRTHMIRLISKDFDNF